MRHRRRGKKSNRNVKTGERGIVSYTLDPASSSGLAGGVESSEAVAAAVNESGVEGLVLANLDFLRWERR